MQNKVGHGALERLQNGDVVEFLNRFAVVKCVSEILRVIAWADAEDEGAGAGAGVCGA